MAEPSTVLEYKCPCCGSPLAYSSNGTEMVMFCSSCGNNYDVEAIKEIPLDPGSKVDFQWGNYQSSSWSQEDQEEIRSFTCPSCAGEIITDATTAATFCPYCENPAIIPGRVLGGLKPDAVIPFKTTVEDAKAAFKKICQKKPLLPKDFTGKHIDKITGVYVPYWLYDCQADGKASYNATRVSTWRDSKYRYTKTDHFLLNREGSALFTQIPMDASQKMDDTMMESLEPFDFSQLVDFKTAYLSGYLADKYDVQAENGEDRIRQRVESTFHKLLDDTCVGYASFSFASRNLNIHHSNAKYVLLPVWLLNVNYEGKLYTFAMNGQSGKMTGNLPVCKKTRNLWFAAIAGGVTAVAAIIQMIGLYF